MHYVVSTDFFKSPVQKQVPCGNLFEVVAHKVGGAGQGGGSPVDIVCVIFVD